MIEKLKKLKRLIPFLITIFVIVFFHYSRIYVLKFYPVITNSFIFIVFFFIFILQRNRDTKNCKKNGWRINGFFKELHTKPYIRLVHIFIYKPFNFDFNRIFACKNLDTI